MEGKERTVQRQEERWEDKVAGKDKTGKGDEEFPEYKQEERMKVKKKRKSKKWQKGRENFEVNEN